MPERKRENPNNREMIRENWSPAQRLAGESVNKYRPLDLLMVSAASLHTEHGSNNCIL